MATTEHMMIPGVVGDIETDIHDPGEGRAGIVVIAHPHPPQGGTKDHKVVTTLARTFADLNQVALRPNFRGVGASAGKYDDGVGETDDILAVIDYAQTEYGNLPLTLAGFSFGGYVMTRVAQQVNAHRIILIAPSVKRFPAPELPKAEAGILIVHGDADEIVPLAHTLEWARPQQLPIVVVPGVEHFFHGRLQQLRDIVTRDWKGSL